MTCVKCNQAPLLSCVSHLSSCKRLASFFHVSIQQKFGAPRIGWLFYLSVSSDSSGAGEASGRWIISALERHFFPVTAEQHCEVTQIYFYVSGQVSKGLSEIHLLS